jgi:cation diffusion facilitator family transporter
MAAESRTAIYASIAANVAIAITKFIVAGIAHSTAMLAEGVHSLVNCFDGGLLLLGQRRARRPADDAHPFGYGRELYFWSLIVAILFFALGSGFTIYEGIRHVRAPGPLGDPTWSYVVIAAAAVFDGASFVVGLRQFRRHMRAPGYWRAVRRSKDPSLFSVVLEDTADLSGLAIAFVGMFLSHRLGMPVLDGVASIAIGLLLGAVATILLVETHGLLVGEAASPELIDAIHRTVLEEGGVRAASRPASLHVGPQDIVVALQVEFEHGLTADQVAESTVGLDERLRARYPAVQRVFVQPTPHVTAEASREGGKGETPDIGSGTWMTEGAVRKT